MAKCDEGYLCDVCGEDVSQISESQLYLLYVIGEVDPELLHTSAERHVRCNPILAKFVVDPDFEPVRVHGELDKRNLDAVYVAERERLVTRGWLRLQEVVGKEIPIIEYPLPEVIEELGRDARRDPE